MDIYGSCFLSLPRQVVRLPPALKKCTLQSGHAFIFGFSELVFAGALGKLFRCTAISGSERLVPVREDE